MIYLCRENSDAQEGSLHLTLSKPTKGNYMGFFCIYITTIYLNVRYFIVLHGTSTLLFDDYDNVDVWEYAPILELFRNILTSSITHSSIMTL